MKWSVDWENLFSEWICLSPSDASILAQRPMTSVRRELIRLESDNYIESHFCRSPLPLYGIWYRVKKHPPTSDQQLHQKAVVRTVTWILRQFPQWVVFSENYLRYQLGWYNKVAPYGTLATPFYTYVPDALFQAGQHYLRLEVQLSRVGNLHFARMIEAAQDNYPIILCCLPRRFQYFSYKCKRFQRIRVFALGNNVDFRQSVQQFGLTAK